MPLQSSSALAVLLLAAAPGIIQSVMLNIPPRFMWGWGDGLSGYCGEATIQSSGLFYGNWVSQERVRLAGGNAEVLVGLNAESAATSLRLVIERWNSNSPAPQNPGYLTWVRSHIDRAHPVVGTVYSVQGSDTDYDHIVPFVGYDSTTVLYYNDLYSPSTRSLALPAAVKTRSQCTTTSNVQLPDNYCIPKGVDWGFAVTGVVDPKGELVPITLSVGRWDEPDWGAEDRLNEPLVTLRPVVTARGLTPGVTYALLRFDTAASLPSAGGFLAAAWSEKVTFTATGTSASVSSLGTISSGGTYFYRCVVAA